LREFKALNRLLRGVEPAEAVDYTEQRNESIRYPEQNSGPELLKGLALDSFTFVEKERRLDLEWGGAGENWEGKAQAAFFRLGLPYGPDLPGYKDLAGLVAKASWRVAQADPNRLNLVGDLESYLWTALIDCATDPKTKRQRCITWEIAKLEIGGAYTEWYRQLNTLKVLSSDAHGNAISLDRKAYAEGEGAEWLANDYDQRVNNWQQEEGGPLLNLNDWESYVEAKVNVEYLLLALPAEIRDIIVKKADGVTLTPTERKRLSRFLRGGPTKRRTSPDGRDTNTPANSFQVRQILDGGIPADQIVSWHKSQRT
jgi:hypothetical protein